MNYLLENKVADNLLSSEYTLAGTIAFITILIMLFFFYNEIYGDKECGSHFDKLVKVSAIGVGSACVLTYLYKAKIVTKNNTCIYASLE